MSRLACRSWLLLALLGSLLGAGFGPPQLLERDASAVPLPASQLRALQTYKSPLVTARAAILVDAASDAVLYAKNAEERVAPASLTKMMTALVALERGRLDQRITASERVRVEPVVIGLDPGETLTLEDLLYGLLLNSGNDAAIAIAEGVGGSIERFVAWMNEKAAALGMQHTHFLNPHGLDMPGHYSTAEDLARLTIAMMRNPVLARIAGTREHIVPGPPLYRFRNTNPLLGVYDGVNGGKTGFTDLAGRCLAVSAVRGGHQVVAVVLDSQNIALDGQVLLDYVFGNYDWLPVTIGRDGAVAYHEGEERREARLAAAAAVAVSRWDGGLPRVQVALEQGAAGANGRVGRVIVEAPLRHLGTFDLIPQPTVSQ
ncbi:MAG TPA: D-alanyl-D-alanine carboxypeptidase family protein [Chloroflexota bacterium]|nr:D-alanyl-D-alanine carboxypeptidase family protein [Chloroflexota bacterium]